MKKSPKSRLSRFIASVLAVSMCGLYVPHSEHIHEHNETEAVESENHETEPLPVFYKYSEPDENGFVSMTLVDASGNIVEPDLMPVYGDKASVSDEYFNLVDEGRSTSVKDQDNTGTCWAHAGMAAIESNLITNGYIFPDGTVADKNLDLSEAHMVWFYHGASSSDLNDPMYGDGEGIGTDAYDKGGSVNDVSSYLARWSGIQYESSYANVITMPELNESARYKSLAHIAGTTIYDSSDISSIKSCLMENGAMMLAYYNDWDYFSRTHSSYYYNIETDSTNHAVTLIGWDDNFSKNNFEMGTPEKDGAWICKNSWGTDGYAMDNGYFYISYYDTSLDNIASIEMTDTDNFSGTYQYDGISYAYWPGGTAGISGANIFEAEKDENISAVSFYTTDAQVPYQVWIYKNNDDGKPMSGELLTTFTGTMMYAGYHIVDLPQCVGVKEGENFSVVVYLNKAETGFYCDNYNIGEGISFKYYGKPTTTTSWTDTIKPYTSSNSGGIQLPNGYNMCIKAHTNEGILINSENFPDDNFRSYVSESFDEDGNMLLSPAEIAKINQVNVYNTDIQSLKGIEFFTELTSLTCSYNPLGSLTLTNTKLQSLYCYKCELEELDVSSCTALKTLSCGNNQLIYLDLTSNPSITTLNASNCSRSVDTVSCGGFTMSGLNMSKVSNVQGATVSGSKFKPTATTITYTYACNSSKSADFKLYLSGISHGTYSDWEENDDETHIQTCSVCGDENTGNHVLSDWQEYTETKHIKECSICDYYATDDHNFGTWSLSGETATRICTDCNYVDICEHSFGKWEEKDAETHTHTCSICGVIVSDEHNFGEWSVSGETATRICTDCNYVDTCEHSFGKWEEKDAETHTHTCSICGVIVSDEHNFSEWTTTNGMTSKTCVDCNYVETCEHSFGDWEENDAETHTHTCSICGVIVSDEHNFSEWSISGETATRICTDCNYVDTCEHSFGKWEEKDAETHTHTCSICGVIVPDEHNFGEWTTTNGMSSKTCVDCNYVETCEHSFGEWTINDEAIRTCEICGYIDICEHEFSEWEESGSVTHVHECSICKFSKAEIHVFGEWTTENGITTRTCTDCGYLESCKHRFSSWKENEDGTYTRTCTRCNTVENCRFGDLNGDDIIDVFDLILLRSGFVNGFTDYYVSLASDIDRDNSITVIDITILNNYLLGTTTEL